jgi:hypothetical protein
MPWICVKDGNPLKSDQRRGGAVPGDTGRLIESLGSRRYETEIEFRQYLLNESNLSDVLQHNNLYVIIALLGFSTSAKLQRVFERKGFRIAADLGAVWHIKHEPLEVSNPDSEPFEAYVALDWENGLAIHYTDFRKTAEIDRVLVPVIARGSSEMDLFVIYPSLIHRTLDSVFEEYPDGRITEFSARTSSSSTYGRVKRAPCKRSIHYWGGDGREAYPELRDMYGTAISSAAVELPRQDTKLRISHTGTVTLCNGDPSVFFHILDRYVLPEARRQRSIVYRSKRDYVEIGSKAKQRSVPVVIPLTIRLNSPLQYYEVNASFSDSLESQDFQVLSFLAEEGSLFLRASLFDSKRLSRFDIWANEEFIKVLPGEHTRLSTLLRFYEFVLREVDPYAVLEA